MKALVVFSSEAEKEVYQKIADGLKSSKKDFDLKVVSIHRDPEYFESLLEEGYTHFIAGSGLSSHLASVIASKTLKLVIGVPINLNYEGLDSLLSIMQMPPGFPVLSVGVNSAEEAVKNLVKMSEQYEFVTILGDKGKSKKCTELLERFGINYEFSTEPNENSININFTDINKASIESDSLIINVPVSDSQKAENSFKLLNLTKKGLWVGLNRSENAAVACVQMMNLDKRYDEKLNAFRSSIKQHKKIEKKKKEEKKPELKQEKVVEKVIIKEKGFGLDALKQLSDFKLSSEIVKTSSFRFIPQQYKNPVIVSSSKSFVGLLKNTDFIDENSVPNMINYCINDILSKGAMPLFMHENIREDLTPFVLGVTDKNKPYDSSRIVNGDVVIGIKSDSLNYSGIDKILEIAKKNSLKINQEIPALKTTLKKEINKPVISYLKAIKSLSKTNNIKAMAFIREGGIPKNLKSIVPKDYNIEISLKSWEKPELFSFIQKLGGLHDDDMFENFNLGIGFVIVVPQKQGEETVKKLKDLGFTSSIIGDVVKGEQNVVIKKKNMLSKLFN